MKIRVITQSELQHDACRLHVLFTRAGIYPNSAESMPSDGNWSRFAFHDSVTDQAIQNVIDTYTAEDPPGAGVTPHQHLQSDIADLTTSLSSKCAANDPRLSDARPPLPHNHDSLYAPLNHTHAGGSGQGKSIIFHPPNQAASAIATNLALNAFNAVSDPNYRQIHDLRGLTKVRIQGRIGGTLVADTKLRIQYHLGGNPAVVTGDQGWATFADSAGGHTVNVMFYSAEIAIPSAAQVNNVLLRIGLLSGNGVADPTITCAILNLYP